MPGRLYLADQGLSFTAKAIETISGGQIVRAFSGANPLTTTNFFGDLPEVALVDAAGDHTTAVGVAIETATSGNRIGVASSGYHGFYASNAVSAGMLVLADGSVSSADAVIALLTPTVGSVAAYNFGRALVGGASGQLVPVRIG